jgi:hypothetical protein
MPLIFMEKYMTQILKITNDEEVILDPEHVQFTEANLNEFLQKAPGWFSYYSAKQSMAQYVASLYEDMYDQKYSEKFRFYKAEGGSDKLAEASAKTDTEVVEMLKTVRKSKENLTHITGFLRALDKANQNALNLGYNLRKEMQLTGNRVVEDKSLEEILGTRG